MGIDPEESLLVKCPGQRSAVADGLQVLACQAQTLGVLHVGVGQFHRQVLYMAQVAGAPYQAPNLVAM